MGHRLARRPTSLGTTAAIIAFGLLAGGADAPPDRAPDWLSPPKPADILAVFPPGAMQRGRSGKATIACTVSIQGRLKDCVIASESPAGEGFGAAALALTPQLLMKPAIRGGKPVEGTVRIPINFNAVGPQGPMLTNTVVSNVPWLEAPTYAQVVAAYPKKAREQRVAGFAMLDCVFDGEARLKNCMAVQEKPKGQGFGKAARELAPLFKGPGLRPDQKPLKGAHTHLPFTFALEMLDSAEPIVGKPTWASLPSSQEAEAGFPAAASKAGVSSGRVQLACRVAAEGRVEGCTVASEDPPGLGFGEAGLALSRSFRMTAWTNEGLPTIGGKVRIPLRYQLKQAAAAAPAPKP